mgnify:FL=1|tara:strand:+ start:566 stop:940 length:375 start_codon:yes stop_codon:yes gene_type:complete
MRMSSIRKGSIGEMKVTIDLLLRGYNVYTPVVDDKGIDLIVSNGDLFRKVQCKSHSNYFSTSVEVNMRGCDRADVVAVPIKPINRVCYIESGASDRAVNIAIAESISGQKLKRRWWEDYLEFPW